VFKAEYFLKKATMLGVKKSRRAYRKSTPVGRLRRNAEKMALHATLLMSRVSSWGVKDVRLEEVSTAASAVVDVSSKVCGILDDLERAGFVPPEKRRVVAWEAGQRVALGDKFRVKYEAAFRDELKDGGVCLDTLVVDKVLASGEVVVRREGGGHSFIVPKTHLTSRSEAATA
jgi:hypothetical protein